MENSPGNYFFEGGKCSGEFCLGDGTAEYIAIEQAVRATLLCDTLLKISNTMRILNIKFVGHRILNKICKKK